jgi:hypothetical protein
MMTLLVLLLFGALAFKLVPVYYGNSQLASYADDVAAQAGVDPLPVLQAKLRAKAKELDIPEALGEGAIGISASGTKDAGTCTVTLDYTRTVDLYGVYPLVIATRKLISSQYINAQ